MVADVSYTDEEAARALLSVIGESRWSAVALARGICSRIEGASEEDAARLIYERGPQTLRASREQLRQADQEGFTAQLATRRRTGSAENPITKLFPAAITEERFLELIEALQQDRATLEYTDERHGGHTLSDFTVRENDLELPLNVKSATTRFEKARQLVGLEPDDCVPVPAYKAHGALESLPNLIYAFAVDYTLLGKLDGALSNSFTADEMIVWNLLQRFAGALVTDAEDKFVYSMVKKYWNAFDDLGGPGEFHVISARKSIRILHTKPERTPGIGLKAWGTGASAEVNVHISLRSEVTPWSTVRQRIVRNGVSDVVMAVNRKRFEHVYDPEI